MPLVLFVFLDRTQEYANQAPVIIDLSACACFYGPVNLGAMSDARATDLSRVATVASG